MLLQTLWFYFILNIHYVFACSALGDTCSLSPNKDQHQEHYALKYSPEPKKKFHVITTLNAQKIVNAIRYLYTNKENKVFAITWQSKRFIEINKVLGEYISPYKDLMRSKTTFSHRTAQLENSILWLQTWLVGLVYSGKAIVLPLAPKNFAKESLEVPQQL